MTQEAPTATDPTSTQDPGVAADPAETFTVVAPIFEKVAKVHAQWTSLRQQVMSPDNKDSESQKAVDRNYCDAMLDQHETDATLAGCKLSMEVCGLDHRDASTPEELHAALSDALLAALSGELTEDPAGVYAGKTDPEILRLLNEDRVVETPSGQPAPLVEACFPDDPPSNAKCFDDLRQDPHWPRISEAMRRSAVRFLKIRDSVAATLMAQEPPVDWKAANLVGEAAVIGEMMRSPPNTQVVPRRLSYCWYSVEAQLHYPLTPNVVTQAMLDAARALGKGS